MKTFKINARNRSLEVVAKITDSMVRAYGCRITYDPDVDRMDLMGEAYCYDVVEAVIMQHRPSSL